MNRQKWKTKLAFSAGGVIYKIDQDQIYIALTARLDKNERRIWCLPKGIIEKKEKTQEAALREVKEETGLSGEIVTKIDQIDYWFYWPQEVTRYHKTVYFYLIKFLAGDTQAHDDEVEAAEWFPVEEALEKLTFKNEREIVQKARRLISRVDEKKQKNVEV